MRILILLLLLFPFVAKAELFEDWTSKEKTWFAVGTVVTVLDYSTTYDLLYNQQGFEEINPLYGSHPSKDKLLGLTIGTLVMNYIIADHFNHNQRIKWLVAFTAAKSLGPINNFSIGAQLRF